MAASGSFLSSGWYSSSKGDYVYLEFAWSVSATSIENNYKTIYWELRGKRSASGFVNAGGFNVVIDGETVYSKSTDYRIELRNGTVVASGTKTIGHNADGTRSEMCGNGIRCVAKYVYDKGLTHSKNISIISAGKMK